MVIRDLNTSVRIKSKTKNGIGIYSFDNWNLKSKEAINLLQWNKIISEIRLNGKFFYRKGKTFLGRLLNQ